MWGRINHQWGETWGRQSTIPVSGFEFHELPPFLKGIPEDDICPLDHSHSKMIHDCRIYQLKSHVPLPPQTAPESRTIPRPALEQSHAPLPIQIQTSPLLQNIQQLAAAANDGPSAVMSCNPEATKLMNQLASPGLPLDR